MPTVSIITACSPASVPFIDELHTSLLNLDMPNGWSWQWCVQDDADGALAGRPWADDPRISLGFNDQRRGAAGARNQALLRATGELVWPVDADDLVEASGFAVLLRALESLPGAAGAAGAWYELPFDEARRMRFVPGSTGAKDAGWLRAEIERLGTTPFAMNSVLFRREAVLAVGGWPAYPEWEDTILAVTVANHHPGVVTDEPVGRYRRHPAQTVAQPRFRDPELRARMLAFVTSCGRPTADGPAPPAPRS